MEHKDRIRAVARCSQQLVRAGVVCMNDLDVDDTDQSLRFTIRKFDPPDAKINDDIRASGVDGIRFEMEFPAAFPDGPPKLRVVAPQCAEQTGHVTIGGAVCMALLSHQGWSRNMDLGMVMKDVLLTMATASTCKGPLRLALENTISRYDRAGADAARERMARTHAAEWSAIEKTDVLDDDVSKTPSTVLVDVGANGRMRNAMFIDVIDGDRDKDLEQRSSLLGQMWDLVASRDDVELDPSDCPRYIIVGDFKLAWDFDGQLGVSIKLGAAKKLVQWTKGPWPIQELTMYDLLVIESSGDLAPESLARSATQKVANLLDAGDGVLNLSDEIRRQDIDRYSKFEEIKDPSSFTCNTITRLDFMVWIYIHLNGHVPLPRV